MSGSGVFVNGIAGVVPDHDIHQQFLHWAAEQISDARPRAIFKRMAKRSGIDHRWSVLPPARGGGAPVEAGGFYSGGMPPTSARMELYAEKAPDLALGAVAKLSGSTELDGITHLIVASCTGFMAPGVDQVIADRLGLHGVERTLVGFMGCYAAVAALRLARHVIRSEPAARVLVITVELSSLHLQDEREIEPLLAMLQFSDGAAAALLTAEPNGISISLPFSVAIPRSGDLLGWTIGDTGFSMHLSAEVPGRISEVLQQEEYRSKILNSVAPEAIRHWAVHAGGRSILDAVERGLGLPPSALSGSRQVLAKFGNMSSSTLMFVLANLLEEADPGKGVALAFGPGLAAEGFHFERAA